MVDFIKQYDITTADNTKIYDEHASDMRHNIETTTNNDIINIFKKQPKSVIITGNAGDGKTRICRNVYNALTDTVLTTWSEEGIDSITYNGYEIRIIKDLSELTDEVILRELNLLAQYIESKAPIYYLIAANEGKLTSSLQADERLASIRKIITSQLLVSEQQGQFPDLQVYNLLHISTAENALKIMEKWNQPENWNVCSTCSENQRCIIYHNHKKLSNDDIRKRLYYVYRSLEVSQEHMTIRELLIHLAYTQLGGLTCEDVQRADHSALIEQSKLVYYDNFFGETLSNEVYEDIIKEDTLRQFNPGKISEKTVDDFILNGDLIEEHAATHEQLFGKAIDTTYGYFKYELDKYRKMYDTDKDIGAELVAKWLPKLRRKYYFEMEGELRKKVPYLIDFPQRALFFMILEGSPAVNLNEVKAALISGLNNYYAKQIVSDATNELYITTEKLYVSAIIPDREIKLDVPFSQNKDYQPTHLYLKVRDEYLTVNLVLFEYLMRLSNGGAFSVLEREVDIRLNNFRNLIMHKQRQVDEVNVLSYEEHANCYVLKQLNYRKVQNTVMTYDY